MDLIGLSLIFFFKKKFSIEIFEVGVYTTMFRSIEIAEVWIEINCRSSSSSYDTTPAHQQMYQFECIKCINLKSSIDSSPNSVFHILQITKHVEHKNMAH